MADADFTIDVGLTSEEVQGAAAGGGFAGGFTGSLVVSLLKELKLVMDVISFSLAIVSTGISFLVAAYINYIIDFFKDPVRALLSLGLYIINGILAGLEFMTNSLIGSINGVISAINFLIPGERFDVDLIDTIEIGRFNIEKVLDAYDIMKEQIEDGGPIMEATIGFAKGFVSSFQTQSEIIAESSEIMADNTEQAFDKVDIQTDRTASAITNSLIKLQESFAAMGVKVSTTEIRRKQSLTPTTIKAQEDFDRTSIGKIFNKSMGFS